MTAKPDVTVALEDYTTQGRLPGLCVITGVATTTFFPHVTEVLPEPAFERLQARVERLLTAPPRFGRVVVVRGRIPLAPAEAGLQRRQRIAGTTLMISGIISLIVVAWAAASWAPIAALTSALVVLGAWWLRTAPRRRLPKVVVDEAGRAVTLRGVHPSFAAAVAPPD